MTPRPVRQAGGWVALAAVLVAVLLTSYSAYLLAGWSWDQVVSYESPFSGLDLPAAEAAPPVCDSLVLVIVDGLTEDASRRMSSFQRLREIGADLVLVAEQPSLSYPTWTTILSGAPQQVSGVTTNWFEGRVGVETLIDTALRDGLRVAVVGPESFETLFGVSRADAVSLSEWDGSYLSATLVDEALRIAEASHPDLLVVHLPDVDEAGHDHGSSSDEYARTVRRVDADIVRLVEGTQDARTAYALTSDHGHISSGGHGGWEPEVVRTPAVLGGEGITYANVEAKQSDLAPTLAAVIGVPVPRHSTGRTLTSVLATTSSDVRERGEAQRIAAVRSYVDEVLRPVSASVRDPGLDRGDQGPDEQRLEEAAVLRERLERRDRLPTALAVAAAALVALGLIGAASWRALGSMAAGTVVYYAVYSGAYFLLHGHSWSLSAFNSEKLIEAFFNTRMIEAASAGVVAAAVAAAVYPLLRSEPRAPAGPFLPRWLVLGPATVLAVQATLALQVAWFLWWYGAEVTWRLPDLLWGFKYDLDLVQMTALGAAALVAPVVSWLVGRYHPRVRATRQGDTS